MAEVKCRCWKPTDPQIDCPLTEHRTAARVRLDVEAALRAERDDPERTGNLDAHTGRRLPPVSLSVPKTVTILGQEFTVKVLTRDESLYRGAPESAVGATDLNKQVIMVRGPEDLSAHQALETLVHETLHGIFYLFGLRAHILDEDDEPLIKVLAPALLHTLRDNPLLVEAITSEIEGSSYGEALHVHAD